MILVAITKNWKLFWHVILESSCYLQFCGRDRQESQWVSPLLCSSKKKFIWEFRIGDNRYNIALVSSALSGKRSITLNSEEIYSEKKYLETYVVYWI